MEHASVGFVEFLNGALVIAFSAWSAALWGARKDLKEMRGDFMDSMTALTKEITHLREDLNGLANRVTRVEVEQSHYHPRRES